MGFSGSGFRVRKLGELGNPDLGQPQTSFLGIPLRESLEVSGTGFA